MTETSNTHMGRVVMGVVTGVWALSFLADIFVGGYEPSPFIHMAMMGVLGALFGRDLLRGNDR